MAATEWEMFEEEGREEAESEEAARPDRRLPDLVRKALEAFEKRLNEENFKPTLAEYLKLLQFEQEVIQEDEIPREITVTWVEPETDLFRGIGYDPLPSQKTFHRSRSRFKGFSGPIGSGKSQALCHEAIRMSYLNPGRMGLVGAPTFPMLRDATQAALFELLESNRIPFEHNKAENVTTLTDTKSRVIFRSVDEFERLRGTNLAWFGLDELTYSPEGAWLRLEGRLRDPKAKRLCGFAVWTPKGFDWVYRRFFSDRVSGYAAIVAKPFENRHLLSQVPDFYERLKESYDEKFYQQEVLGSYLALTGGRVYWNFSRNDHVTDLQLDRNRTLFWALDFNVDPMCSVIAQRVGRRGAGVGRVVCA